MDRALGLLALPGRGSGCNVREARQSSCAAMVVGAQGASTAMSSTFYRVLAVDFDGTLSEGGAAPASDVLDAPSVARASGLRIVLVIGRILGKLEEVRPTVHESVDCVIAENGEVLLAVKAADEPSIVASIRSLELGCQAVANRTELMVLPAGVPKGTVLFHTLGHLGLSFHNTIAVGDAENDLLLYDRSELAVAVRNAVQPPRERADIVLADPDGSGVGAFVPGDVLHGRRKVHSKRCTLRIGDTAEGRSAVLTASQTNVLIAGSTGSGKSYVAGLLTRVEAHRERTGLPHRVVLDEADPTVERAATSLEVLEPTERELPRHLATRAPRR